MNHFMNNLLTFCLLVSFATALSGQVTPVPKVGDAGMAIGISDVDLIDKMMATMPGFGNTRDRLQQQTVKQFMMPVRTVGLRGDDLSYSIASCLEFYVNLNKNYKVNLSPDYISLSIKSQGKSVNFKEAFQFLVHNGTVSAAILPYDASAITSAVYATQKFKVSNYLHIFRELTSGRQRVFEARKALMRGNPVLIEVNAGPGIKSQQGNKYIELKGGTQKYPLVIVGFDEIKEAFEVMSCWGNSWGNGGYGWITYDDFSKYAANGYVFVPEQSY